ncbi:alpha/beta hydrolase [Lactobacillus sp. DCY120]|uniref:Alpha/beta hydrolase n=1 Tax=Bombilactobacillus apium TaxID=2675299 RepID=A0A850R2J0_9LACO|nr:alpha/beta hydrolase [Bombilactobacillus apium]NVY96231.1 alpha/beta hydrolase [Bombilactobacillus apium]
MELITSDHVRLNYTDQGQGPIWILLSGIGCFAAVWRPTQDFLVKAGYRVITLDARNQGLSEHTWRGRRISRHAADVHELVEHLALKEFGALGNSLGAATWWAYCSLFGSKKIRALIDLDQSPKMLQTPDWSWGFKDLTSENFFTSLSLPLGRATIQKMPDDVYAEIQVLQEENPYDPELNYPLLADHALQDWRDVILTLTCPQLFIAGQESPFFNPDFATHAAEMAPRGQAQVIAQSGHLPMLEQPVAFQKVMTDFLRTDF